MPPLRPLDIYALLDKSNCKACGLPSCMAFALAAASGEKRVSECPRLDKTKAQRMEALATEPPKPAGFDVQMDTLRENISGLDFPATAQRLGAILKEDKLLLKCFSKEYLIDKKGRVQSECHINSWVEGIVLSYLSSEGEGQLSGQWVAFENLKDAATVAPYFLRRCETPLKALADSHTDIFFELLEIFGGRHVDGFSADQAMLLHPLPRVPWLILYSKAEGEFESTLKILFDSTADTYLGLDVISALGRSIVEMFQRIIDRHEKCSDNLLFL